MGHPLGKIPERGATPERENRQQCGLRLESNGSVCLDRRRSTAANRWRTGNLTFRFCYSSGLKSVVIDVKRDARQSLVKTLRLAETSSYAAKPLIYIFILESEGRLRELINVDAYGASEPKEPHDLLRLGPS